MTREADKSRILHMAIARSLFRRLVAKDRDWRGLFQKPDMYATRKEALAALDALPEALVWMPACDDHDETGRCNGHDA